MKYCPDCGEYIYACRCHKIIMQEYVVGFLFSDCGSLVALIEKQKPEWQKGRWNGIGGKIEPGEEPEISMPREFAEETGITVITWQLFARIEGDWGKLHCFTAKLSKGEDLPDLLQMEEERPAWIAVNLIRDRLIPIIPNLTWLIPLALDNTSGMVVCQDIPVNNA